MQTNKICGKHTGWPLQDILQKSGFYGRNEMQKKSCLQQTCGRSCSVPKNKIKCGGIITPHITMNTPAPLCETRRWQQHNVGMLFFSRDRDNRNDVKLDGAKYRADLEKKNSWRLGKNWSLGQKIDRTTTWNIILSLINNVLMDQVQTWIQTRIGGKTCKLLLSICFMKKNEQNV